MCGICGFSGKYPVDITKMRWLIQLNEERGKDSTGIFTVKEDQNKTQTLYKSIQKASNFILDDEVYMALRGATSVIAHTRLSTFGLVNQKNAHPFIKGKVVGVHNGFVIQELLDKYKLDEKFDVDSELIFAYLDAHDGDFRKLKDIEGAITVSYMIPDKYPDVVNLYRREARELHFGRSREGIYFSSEAGALERIGCTHILEIPDMQFMSLRHGEVLDSLLTEPPIIKSIPLGTQRSGWKLEKNKDEWSQYEALKPVVYEHIKSHKQRSVGFQSSFMDTNKSEDIRGALIKHVVDDVKFITSKAPPYPSESYNYDKGDTDSCIIVLYLENSNKKGSGLAGFIVFDKTDNAISGITAINGVTALKYRWEKCDLERTLVMADPIDGTHKWEYTIKPEKGRVLEVALQLPFPQEKSRETPNLEGSSRDIARKAVAGLAGDQLSLLSSATSGNGGISTTEKLVPEDVSEADAEIHQRSEEEPIFGESGLSGGENQDVFNAESGSSTNGKTIRVLNKEEITQIISNERNSFTYKRKILGFHNTAEYMRFMAIFGYYMGKYFQVAQITSDAANLKFAQLDKDKNCWAFGIYVVTLMEKLRDSYIIKHPLTDEDVILINAFIKLFKTGKLKKPPLMSNTSPDLELMALATEQIKSEALKKKESASYRQTPSGGAAILGTGRIKAEGVRLHNVSKPLLSPFIIPRSFYRGVLEFVSTRYHNLDNMPIYTDEKRKAMLAAVASHNLRIKEGLQDVKEIRSFCESKTTLEDIELLDSCANIAALLSRLQEYNEEFMSELRKP